MSPSSRFRPPWQRDMAVALAALLMIVAWEALGWDWLAASLYADGTGFALRHHALTQRWGHDGGRLLAALALLAFAVMAWRTRLDEGARSRAFAWLGVVLLCLVAVPALKRINSTSCPWDLIGLGGAVPYVPHWLLGARDGGPGHCFPSGHAVAAFAFFPLYFQWRDARPELARALLWTVLAAGVLFGWVQMARGAHFASHTMWSAWLCWVIAAIGAWWIDGRAAAHGAPRLATAAIAATADAPSPDPSRPR